MPQKKNILTDHGLWKIPKTDWEPLDDNPLKLYPFRIALSLLLKSNSTLFRNTFSLWLSLKNRTGLSFTLSKFFPTIPFLLVKMKKFMCQLIFAELAFGLLIYNASWSGLYCTNTQATETLLALNEFPFATILFSMCLCSEKAQQICQVCFYQQAHLCILSASTGMNSSLLYEGSAYFSLIDVRLCSNFTFCIVDQFKQATHIKFAFEKFVLLTPLLKTFDLIMGGFEWIHYVTTPSKKPQAKGKIEQLHQELGKLSQIYSVSPDE